MSMRLNRLSRGACLTAVIFGISAPAALANILESDQFSGVQDNFDPQISGIDLINRGQASFLNTTGSDIGYGSSGPDNDGVSGSNDGVASNESDLSKIAYYTNGPSTPFKLIYNLNLTPGTGGSATGYDITGVKVFNGWGSYPLYSNQIWTLSVATVASPSTFVDLFSVNYAPYPGLINTSTNSSLVSLTDTGPLTSGLVTATGIAALRFTITSAGGGGSVTREIDVFGAPTAIPEPASLSILGVVALLLLRRLRAS